MNGLPAPRVSAVTPVLLTMPCIIGTAGLVGLSAFADASVDFLSSTAFLGSVATGLFVLAMYGPLLLIVAAPLNVRLTRRRGFNSSAALCSWGALLIGLAAAAAFYLKIIDIAPVP